MGCIDRMIIKGRSRRAGHMFIGAKVDNPSLGWGIKESEMQYLTEQE